MIRVGKKFSKPEMSRVINGDTELPEKEEKEEKVRLDHILVEQHPEYNRASLQTFIKSGFVTVNGETILKPNSRILPNAKIELKVPETDKSIFLKPEIIFEDENVIVLNKPAGMLSMTKGEYCPEPTLEDYGLIVHRLDRDTSGVVILAKNPETEKMLRKQFQDRKTHKTYYAIVEGRPKLDEAMIDLPINRNLKKPTTFLVEAGGKPSRTYYRVIQSCEKYSLIELKPETGRTHQLRVHLKYLGTPIVGDTVYGTAKWEEKDNSSADENPEKTGVEPISRPRLFLHAKELEITIPGTSGEGNQRKTFTAPLPKEFSEFIRDVF